MMDGVTRRKKEEEVLWTEKHGRKKTNKYDAQSKMEEKKEA